METKVVVGSYYLTWNVPLFPVSNVWVTAGQGPPVLILGLTAYTVGCLPKSRFLPSSLKIEPSS